MDGINTQGELYVWANEHGLGVRRDYPEGGRIVYQLELDASPPDLADDEEPTIIHVATFETAHPADSATPPADTPVCRTWINSGDELRGAIGWAVTHNYMTDDEAERFENALGVVEAH